MHYQYLSLFNQSEKAGVELQTALRHLTVNPSQIHDFTEELKRGSL